MAMSDAALLRRLSTVLVARSGYPRRMRLFSSSLVRGAALEPPDVSRLADSARISLAPGEVKPVIKLLKQTLVGTGVLLVGAVSLFIFAAPAEDFLHSGFVSNRNNPTPNSQSKLNLRKEELLRLPIEVKDDDDLAAAAAEAADGRPVYCRDRFYRALAGGQYCKWDDLMN